MSTASATNRYSHLQGLGRGMAILEALAERPMRPAQLCDLLDLKWTTGYRSLAYLREAGFVRRDQATGAYSIAARLYSIGSAYLATSATVQGARPLLRAAAEAGDATAQLAERDRRRSIVLAAAEPRDNVIPKATPGFHFPLHCGSKGHVLLAYAEPDIVETYLASALEQLTAHSLTNPDALRTRLAEVREQGFAVTTRDVQLSAGSVASPIRDSDGTVTACVCLVSGAADIEERADELVEIALSTSRSISLLLGWRPAMTAR